MEMKPVQFDVMIVTAVVCEDEPDVINAYVSLRSGDTYRSTAVYSCRIGYIFERDVMTYNTTCSAYGDWEPKLTACRGTSQTHFSLISVGEALFFMHNIHHPSKTWKEGG